MSKEKSIISRLGEGEKLSAFGIDIYFRATVEKTNGLWSMIEYHLPPSPLGPPPHYHKKMQEIFYVLEGELEFILAGKSINAPAGTLVAIAKNDVHTFKNSLDSMAKFLIWFSPGGFEQYFIDMEDLVKTESSWPPSDMTKVFALMAKHDTFPAKSKS